MKFCTQCGASVEDHQMYCTSCGAAFAAAPQYNQAPQYAPPAPQYAPPQYNAAPQYAPPQPSFASLSNWDGGVMETFVASIVASLMISFTCGIATPWAVCYLWNFILSHATIDGKRLRFDGNGADLLGQWIVWMLLTVVTCGIYSFWVMPKMYKWIASHTHFA